MVSISSEPCRKYVINGDYIGEGIEGNLNGGVYYYSDRKLIGFITDECNGISIRRALLGVHSPKNNILSFIHFNNLETLPTCWITIGSPHKTENLGETYIGHWSFLTNILVPCKNGLPRLKDLQHIPVPLLNEVYFSRQLTDKIKNKARRNNLCGKLNFNLKV